LVNLTDEIGADTPDGPQLAGAGSAK